jgi:hypothetical protein
MFKLKSLTLTSIFLLSVIIGLNAQDAPLKLTDTTKQVLQLPTSSHISLIYSKRYIPTFTSITDDFKLDGNNFYGISFSSNIHLTNDVYLACESSVQLGNMYGNFSEYISIMPKILIGGTDILNVYFGAGPCALGVNDKFKDFGGLGIAAGLGFTFNLYKGFGLTFGYQHESYQNASYNNFNFGINYRFK